MSPRWQAIDRLFHAALERAASHRETFVRAEAADEELANEVLELLAAAAPDENRDGDDVPAQPLDLQGLMDALGGAFLIGQKLNHYRVAEFLGEGGMGLVYRAIDERDGSMVAIKILPPDQARHPRRLDRFHREARAMAAIRHPAIVRIHETGSGQGLHYLVMDYLPGETLQQRVRRAGPLSEAEAIECGLAISAALEAAHQAGVTHRDLKPENVMLTADGAKVFDFGVAHLDERDSPQRTTLEGVLSGTVAYLAPEQIEGAPGTPQSDIFAFGVVLYEAVTGQTLFQRANPIATARAILHEQPNYKKAPVALRPLLRRCLEKNRRRRYQAASQVHSDLEKIKSGVSPIGLSTVWTRVAVGAAILVLAGVYWLPMRFQDKTVRQTSATGPGSAAASGWLATWREAIVKGWPMTLLSRSTPTPSGAAELYLKGRYYWEKRTPADLYKAVDYFTQSTVANPRYAKAYVGLADSYGLLREFAALPDSEAWPRALSAARKAVELDGSSAEAHGSLGFDLFYGSLDLKGGELEFKRAVQLNPNYTEAHHWYATALMSVGRFAEASDEMERARELQPSSRSILADQGLLLFYEGKNAQAAELLRQIETEEPAFRSPHLYLSYIYFETKDCQSYLSELRKAAESSHDPVELALVAEAENGFAAGGERSMFESLLRVQKKSASEGRYPAYLVAKTSARLGKQREALDYLATAYKRREQYIVLLPADPALASLHAEPAYRNLLAQLGVELPN